MSKISEAIEKITTEVNATSDEKNQVIGEYLIDSITEATAEKILMPGKTVSGCFKHLYDIAFKQQKNRSYCYTSPTEIDNYYGITPEDKKAGATITKITPPPAQSTHINLMDLL